MSESPPCRGPCPSTTIRARMPEQLYIVWFPPEMQGRAKGHEETGAIGMRRAPIGSADGANVDATVSASASR